MTIIQIDTNINNSLRTSGSEELSVISQIIDNNRYIMSPNYCTTCHGGGCPRCTSIN